MPRPSVLDRLLRIPARLAVAAIRRVKARKGGQNAGAHAIALTESNRIVLVRLRYAPGWRLPGGGRHPDEDPCRAAIRELEEEIGLTCYSEAAPARAGAPPDGPGPPSSLICVRGVRYRPRWSLEVERAEDFALDALPDRLSPLHRRWIAQALGLNGSVAAD